MAYCRKCGKEIDNEAVICPHCGVQQKSLPSSSSSINDTGGLGWGLLGFFIPVVGLILYLVWKDEKPNTAKSAGKGALIAVILGVLMYILMIIILVSTNYYVTY